MADPDEVRPAHPATVLDVAVEPGGTATLVRVRGELDVETCPAFDEQLRHCRGEVILDASGLRFVSSAGLSALIDTANRLEAEGGRLQLRAPSAPLARLLQITRLDDRFPLA